MFSVHAKYLILVFSKENAVAFHFSVRLLLISTPYFKTVIESAYHPENEREYLILDQIVQVWIKFGSLPVITPPHAH